MPRQARLDVPGALHHVMGRGIDRRPIFAEEKDREDFLARLEKLVEKESLGVYAWALMPKDVYKRQLLFFRAGVPRKSP